MKFFSYLIALFLFSAPAFSAALYGEIRDDKFQWRNLDTAYSVGGFNTPAFWDLPSSLPAAKAWIPGGVSGPNELTVNLTSTKGSRNTIPLTIRIEGIQYKSSDYGNVSGEDEVTQLLGNYVSVLGTTMGKKLIKLKAESNALIPFTHIRPLISIDEHDIQEAFKDIDTSELYQGTVTFQSQYDYYRVCNTEKCTGNNDIKIRNILTHHFRLQIHHYKDELHKVDIMGSDKMVLHFEGGKVSGSVTYTVKAEGFLNHGVKVELQNNQSPYLLTYQEDNSHSIEYGVVCNRGCENANHVFINEDGIGNNNSTIVYSHDYQRSVAEITAFFTDYVYEKEGLYEGSFSLIFSLPDV